MIPQRTVLLLLVAMLVACGASAREKTLKTSLRSLNVARDTVLAVSDKREGQIYDACNPPTCTKEEGHKQVDEWRAKVDVVVKAIDAGYRAIFAASLLEDAESLSEATAAVVIALALVKELAP